MLSKKMAIVVAIGLGILVDLAFAFVMLLVTGGEYGEFMASNPILYIPLCIVIYGGTWRYVKKNFTK